MQKPPYPLTIRQSTRAKYLTLRVSLEKGVEVVVPEGCDPERVTTFLLEKDRWLQKALKRVEEQRRSLQRTFPDTCPQSIVLSAIQEEWSITYEPTASTERAKVTLREKPHKQLYIQGGENNPEAYSAVLHQWLSRKAYQHLVPWLQKTSEDTQLPFSKVTIRNQKTRWGSCSSRHAISLNYKLLFLEAAIVQYVLIHELCHTVHLNHSARFWALVQTHEPNYSYLDTALKYAWKSIPPWAAHIKHP